MGDWKRSYGRKRLNVPTKLEIMIMYVAKRKDTKIQSCSSGDEREKCAIVCL